MTRNRGEGLTRSVGAPLVAALLSVGALWAAGSPTAEAQLPEAPAVTRLAGTDRYATAAAASARLFPDGAATVVVVSGETFADAVAAGPVARALGAPMLLSRQDEVPPVVMTELVRLRAQRAIVVGGDAAVGQGVINQLRERVQTVERVEGGDRYGTAVALSAMFFGPGRHRVYVATGEDFADALVAGAAASHDGDPLLLTRHDSLPDVVGAEVARLDPDEVWIVGGSSSIGDQVREQLLDRLRDRDHDGDGIPDQDRDRDRDRIHLIAGTDRLGTSAALAAVAFPSPTGRAFVANGWSFSDAAVASALGDPILLVERDRITDQVRLQLDRLCTLECVVVGGTAVVSDTVMQQLAE